MFRTRVKREREGRKGRRREGWKELISLIEREKRVLKRYVRSEGEREGKK